MSSCRLRASSHVGSRLDVSSIAKMMRPAGFVIASNAALAEPSSFTFRRNSAAFWSTVLVDGDTVAGGVEGAVAGGIIGVLAIDLLPLGLDGVSTRKTTPLGPIMRSRRAPS